MHQNYFFYQCIYIFTVVGKYLSPSVSCTHHMRRLEPEGTERHFYKRNKSRLKFYYIRNVVTVERIKIFQCYFFWWSCNHLLSCLTTMDKIDGSLNEIDYKRSIRQTLYVLLAVGATTRACRNSYLFSFLWFIISKIKCMQFTLDRKRL